MKVRKTKLLVFATAVLILVSAIASNAVNLLQTFTANGSQVNGFQASTGTQYWHSGKLTGFGTLVTNVSGTGGNMVNEFTVNTNQCFSTLISPQTGDYELASETHNMQAGAKAEARVVNRTLLANPCGNEPY